MVTKSSTEPGAPGRLTDLLVQHVGLVLQRCEVKQLYIEGGTTASALIRSLRCKHMLVCAEFTPGIVALKLKDAAEMTVTMKPGSYPWPKYLIPKQR